MSIIADFAVPGGPTMTMCSPAIAEMVIRRMISCLSRNCAPIWRARSWNAAEARATSTAKLLGVVGGATMRARHITRKRPAIQGARVPIIDVDLDFDVNPNINPTLTGNTALL